MTPPAVDQDIAPATDHTPPLVSFLIPTFNSERHLRHCLESIRQQDYPSNLVEIIVADGGSTDTTASIARSCSVTLVDNPQRTAEAGKLIAYRASHGDVIVLLDSDNVIVGHNWLTSLVRPLVDDPTIVGVESNYLIAANFSSVNTYVTLLKIADPLARMLAASPRRLRAADGYEVACYPAGTTPVIGANGFLWRRTAVESLLEDVGVLNETMLAMALARRSTLRVANVPGHGIEHYYCDTVRDFARKRAKIAGKHLQRSAEGPTWVDEAGSFRVAVSMLYLASVIGPAVEAVRNAIRDRQASWLWHPLLSWLTVVLYAAAYINRRFSSAFHHRTRDNRPRLARSPVAPTADPPSPSSVVFREGARRGTAGPPAVSVVVPSFNRAARLDGLLHSCLASEFRDFEIIINDDPRTSDRTPQVVDSYLALGLDIVYLRENTSRASGRILGADRARSSILLHLDSDMELTPDLLGECYDKLTGGRFDALIIPEESFGDTFWARCKWLEKTCYDGVDDIESLRCMRRSVYVRVGGHDATMVFSEDKDLDLRVRATGAAVGRTRAYLRHNEGRLTLSDTMRTKMYYAGTATRYAAAHPHAYGWEVNPLRRYLLYLRHPKNLMSHPLLAIGLFSMKTCEYAASFVGLVTSRGRRPHHDRAAASRSSRGERIVITARTDTAPAPIVRPHGRAGETGRPD